MPHEVIFSERYGSLGRRIEYVKPPNQNSLVRIDPSFSLLPRWYDGIIKFFWQLFLPLGYPDSVSADYTQYQLWDTLQAFCSTITGTLTTQAIMKGVGVGDTAATPFAAAITWILKDGTGMIGRIIFAWFQGGSLDGNCKKWRLFADFLNDIAMALELLLPMLMIYSTQILCATTAMKAIVGVAGGATRAAITQHQAIRNNMADVSVKDGSQEIFVNFCASIAGIIILATFDEGEYVWLLFSIFASLHLFANFQAVRALQLDTLNNERILILLQTFYTMEIVSSLETVNRCESVILGKGLSDRRLCGFSIKMGVSLQNLLNSDKLSAEDMKLLTNYYRNKKYFIVIDMEKRTLNIALREGEIAIDVIQAYFHATLLGIAISMINKYPVVVFRKHWTKFSSETCSISRLHGALTRLNRTNHISQHLRIPLEAMIATDEAVARVFPQFVEMIREKDWKTTSHHLVVDDWRGEWRGLEKKSTTEASSELLLETNKIYNDYIST